MKRLGTVGRGNGLASGPGVAQGVKGLLAIERMGLISIRHPYLGTVVAPHQCFPFLPSFSLFPVAAPPSALSLGFSSSERRPAGLSLGPGCHA